MPSLSATLPSALFIGLGHGRGAVGSSSDAGVAVLVFLDGLPALSCFLDLLFLLLAMRGDGRGV